MSGIGVNVQPFNLQGVGKIETDLKTAQQKTQKNGLDEIFVESGKDTFVLYGKKADFSKTKVGDNINFFDNNGKQKSGQIKALNDEDNSFIQGAASTVKSAFGKIAIAAAPVAGAIGGVAYIPVARASASAAAQKAITPGGFERGLGWIIRQPANMPSKEILDKVGKEAAAKVSAKNVILTGLAIGAAVAVAIPVYGGIKASNNNPDDTTLKEITGTDNASLFRKSVESSSLNEKQKEIVMELDDYIQTSIDEVSNDLSQMETIIRGNERNISSEKAKPGSAPLIKGPFYEERKFFAGGTESKGLVRSLKQENQFLNGKANDLNKRLNSLENFSAQTERNHNLSELDTTTLHTSDRFNVNRFIREFEGVK